MANLRRKEANLEFWRQKYLRQGVLAFLCLAGVMAAVAFFCNNGSLELLCALFAGATGWLMLKELRESLQARGEGLILSEDKELFGGLGFDVGRGEDENLITQTALIPAYQVRECFNAITGKGFRLTEEFLYTVLSNKYIKLNKTAFRGIVLSFYVSEKEGGRLVFSSGGQSVFDEEQLLNGAEKRYRGFVLRVSAGINTQLLADKRLEAIAALLRYFRAKDAALCLKRGRGMLFIATEMPLFYDFKLFKPNNFASFIRRTLELKTMCEELAAAFEVSALKP